MKDTLLMISRHEPTEEQVAMAHQLGFAGIERVDRYLSYEHGGEQVARLVLEHYGHLESPVALIAPMTIKIDAMTKGVKVLDFAGRAEERKARRFAMKGVHLLSLACTDYGMQLLRQFIPFEGRAELVRITPRAV